MRDRKIGSPSLVLFGCLVLIACGGDGDGDVCPDDGIEVPAVAGSYLVEVGDVQSSNCPTAVNDVLEEAIANTDSCVYELDQDGARLFGVSCDGLAVKGCVDNDGEASVVETATESVRGCNVRLDGEIAANLTGELPVAGRVDIRIRISGNCILETDCVAVTDATLTEVAAVTAGAEGGPCEIAWLTDVRRTFADRFSL